MALHKAKKSNKDVLDLNPKEQSEAHRNTDKWSALLKLSILVGLSS